MERVETFKFDMSVRPLRGRVRYREVSPEVASSFHGPMLNWEWNSKGISQVNFIENAYLINFDLTKM